jgi:hypothetical protein
VLVERVTPPRRRSTPTIRRRRRRRAGVGRPPPLAGSAGEGSVALAGRTRHNKLVHLAGDPGLVGQPVRFTSSMPGPFALRGRLVEAPDEPDVLA